MTFGSLQLKLGPSYLNDFFKSHAKFRLCKITIENSENSKIITTRIKSRHISRKSFRVYIWYKCIDIIQEENQENDSDSLKGWYCE